MAKPEVRPTGIAATVNGHQIPEVAVYRALRQFPDAHKEMARKEITTHLIENTLIDQYLNLIKSSTLGAAIAYPEIFQIFAGTVMNHTGKEVEIIVIVMAVFLTVNLLCSAFMNWYNRRVALVEK